MSCERKLTSKVFSTARDSQPCPHPQTSLSNFTLKMCPFTLKQTYDSGSELENAQRPCFFCGLEWAGQPGPEGERGQRGAYWMSEKEGPVRGPAQRSVRFSTRPQWRLLSHLSKGWCHVSSEALSDAEVCGLRARGGKAARNLQIRFLESLCVAGFER